MTPRFLRRSLFAAAAIGLAWWLIPDRPAVSTGAISASRPREAQDHRGQTRVGFRQTGPRPQLDSAPRADGLVSVTGRVVEVGPEDGYEVSFGPPEQRPGIAGAEVIFVGDGGEASAITSSDGGFRIDLAKGRYRTYARGHGIMSLGTEPQSRLPGPYRPTEAGAPVEASAPIVQVTADTDGVEVAAARSGTISGRVVDGAGRPIRGAMVYPLLPMNHPFEPNRAVDGSDLAETGADGRFHVEAPVGWRSISATFPGFESSGASVVVRAGEDTEVEVQMTAVCLIRGRVVDAHGRPAGEGAIETSWNLDSDTELSPTGRIEADGSFSWQTELETTVLLRAWPWKAAPSPSQRFECRQGKRFEDVVLTIPDAEPDLAGTITLANGSPAAGAYLDIYAISHGGMNQQERADAEGRWGVFSLPPGDYLVSAHVAGQGTVEMQLTSPSRGNALALSGAGTLIGEVVGATGTVRVEVGPCGGGVGHGASRHLVEVKNRQFRLEGLDACEHLVSVRSAAGAAMSAVRIRANDQVSSVFQVSPPLDGEDLEIEPEPPIEIELPDLPAGRSAGIY